TNPDVAAANRIAMFVKHNEPLRRMRLVVLLHDAMPGAAEQLAAMMSDDAIVQDGDIALFLEVVAFPARRFENDVVALPRARRLGSIYQRRRLAVNRTGLSVGIGFVVVRV